MTFTLFLQYLSFLSSCLPGTSTLFNLWLTVPLILVFTFLIAKFQAYYFYLFHLSGEILYLVICFPRHNNYSSFNSLCLRIQVIKPLNPFLLPVFLLLMLFLDIFDDVLKQMSKILCGPLDRLRFLPQQGSGVNHHKAARD